MQFWPPEKNFAILHLRYGSHVHMQSLRDVVHCDYSFVISNPLAKVARLKCMQNITESTVCISVDRSCIGDDTITLNREV